MRIQTKRVRDVKEINNHGQVKSNLIQPARRAGCLVIYVAAIARTTPALLDLPSLMILLAP